MRKGGWTRVAWGVVLSVLMPGLGQVYARTWWPGLAVVLAAQGLMAGLRVLTEQTQPEPRTAAWAAGMLALLPVIWVGAALHAGWRLRRHPAEAPVPWFRTTWFAALPALALAGAVAALPLGWRVFPIRTQAMVPTLRPGDYLLAAIRPDELSPILYGQVVSFTLPGQPDRVHVRRAVGLSGDQVALKRANLVINNRPVGLAADGSMAAEGDGIEDGARRYIETMPNGRRFRVLKRDIEAPANNTQDFIVPPGNLMVLGDNRDGSVDSRDLAEFGYVATPDVVTVDGMVIWSAERARILKPVE